MSGLDAVLAGRRPPGAYRCSTAYDVGSVRRAAEQAGWALVHLEGAHVRDVAGFHAVVAQAFDLPDHYGANLDALHDSLREEPERTVVLWDDWGAFARAEPATFAVALDLLAERHTVLLRGPGPEVAAPALV